MANTTADPARYPPIADYAIVGDCHTAALISRDGAVDWYCPGRFDGPAVFCRLLDWEKGGYLRVAPQGQYETSRRYRDGTPILETTFTVQGARVRVTDFMAIYARTPSRSGHDVGSTQRLLRLVEGLSGDAELELEFRPTFDYARATAELAISDGGVVARAGDHYLTLACPGAALQADNRGGVRGKLHVGAGQHQWIALTYTRDATRAGEALTLGDCAAELERTVAYWDAWVDACTYQGPYREAVVRSAVTLKLLTYEPTGAVVAAPSTSLPEALGGVRNWDYRYTWLRDSSLLLYALMTVGCGDEATDFFHWLEHTCGSDPTRTPQIMYTIDRGHELAETILDHLDGYYSSRPVRLGNAAAQQLQLDIYGEVLVSAHLHFHARVPDNRSPDEDAAAGGGPSADTWALLRAFVEQAEARWQEKDNGIWEVRGGPRHFLYSKLMCWAALDRGIELAREWRLDAPLERWRTSRDQIRRAILEQGFNREVGAFTQSFGSPALDASALAIPRIGFLPATDPRVQSTVERIRTQLTRNGLVDRYHAPDGLPGGEASFALCSFWLVDALALGGRVDDARALFEHLLSYANDVGLLSEEIAPAAGLLLGNFPQGFTHLAIVQSAVNLAKAAKHGAEDRPETEADRARPARQAAAEAHDPSPRGDTPSG